MYKNSLARRWGGAVVLSAIVLVASACGSSSSAGSGTQKLTVAVAGIGAFQTPLYIASIKGYFKKEGLDVTLSYVAANALNLVVGGKADMASVGAANALVPVRSGKETSLIFAQSQVSDAAYVVAALNVNSIEDCKRVATTALGTASNSWASYYKQATKSTYTIVAISDTASVVTTAQSGSTDCAIAPYSTLTSGVESGKLHFIIDPSKPKQLPAGAPAAGPSVAIWGLTDHLKADKETTVKFVRALRATEDYIMATSDAQLAKDLRNAKDFSTQPVESLTAQLSAERPFLVPNGGRIEETSWVSWLDFVRVGLPFVAAGDPKWSYAQRVDMSYFDAANK